MPTAFVTIFQTRCARYSFFVGKRVLRFGIILYGFRLTFQDVVAVGLPAIVIDAIIVCGTILLGVFRRKTIEDGP